MQIHGDAEDKKHTGTPAGAEKIAAEDFEQTIFAAAEADENGGTDDAAGLEAEVPVEKISGYGELRLIGVGGMGTVFEGEDKLLGRKVALKIMRHKMRRDRANTEKFINEARITARVEHPSVVPVHRLGMSEDGGIYFSMKMIDGENLRSIIEKLASGDKEMQKKYTLRRLLEIFISGCNGIAAAHNRGILHCDLKPSNLMVGNFGEVLVLDWGVAREIVPAGKERNVGTDGKIRIEGTPVFMAPELLAGSVDAPDVQTDVYGLGTILYSILTWSVAPFDVNKSPEKLKPLIAAGRFIPIRSRVPEKQPLSPELEAICLKAMNSDRSERYKNADELIRDVHNYLDGYPVEACAPNWLYNFFKLIRRRPLIPSVLVASVISFGIYNLFSELQQELHYDRARNVIAANQGRAETRGYKILRDLKILQNPELKLSGSERQRLEYEILHSCVDAATASFLVFEAVSKLPYESQKEFVIRDGNRMVNRLLNIHLLLGNRDMAVNFIKTLRTSWTTIWEVLQKNAPETMEMISGMENGRGKLSISNSENDIWWWSFDAVPAEENSEQTGLPAGRYEITFKSLRGAEFRAKVRVAGGLNHRIYLNDVPQIPENFCYIPGDRFENHGDNFKLWGRRIPAFMLSRKAVSAVEFEKFTALLPAGHPLKRKNVMQKDIHGNALLRYEDAVEYCRVMSGKSKRKVVLADRMSWLKALQRDAAEKSGRSFYQLEICPNSVEWLNGGGNSANIEKVGFAAFRLCMPVQTE